MVDKAADETQTADELKVMDADGELEQADWLDRSVDDDDDDDELDDDDEDGDEWIPTTTEPRELAASEPSEVVPWPESDEPQESDSCWELVCLRNVARFK